MKPYILALVSGLFCLSGFASENWTFSERLAVTGQPVDGVYIHIEGGNRQHISVNNEAIAVTWEDDRSGDPQIYVSLKSKNGTGFSKAIQLSSGSEAYEPAITAIAENGFAISWEQDGEVFVRSFLDNRLRKPIKLSHAEASHASMVSMDDAIYASWRERAGHEWMIKVALLKLDSDQQLSIEHIQNIEPKALPAPVLFPAMALNSSGLCIAWEDRRAGHTRLMFSYSTDQAKSFSNPQFLNEFYSNRNEYDKGNGVTRVSLAAFAEDEIIAAWMDKRRGENGYGIYGALGSEGGALFGPNERIHSPHGDKLPHYNPATAGNAEGQFVVVWDDYRNGDSDIWLSSYNDDSEWSNDFSPAPASGDREQSHPAVSMDEAGNLHLLWLERSDLNAPGRLWYSMGKPVISD